MILSLAARATEGKHIAHAVLQTRTGATVALAQADASGRVRFTNVPPGEYQLVLTNAEGRSVTLADLDGDGRTDIIIEGRGAASPRATGTFSDGTTQGAAASPGSGAGSGKVNVQDISLTKMQRAPGSPTGGKAPGGALPGGAVVSAGVTSPRDVATGMSTGKRMHKPYACLVDWDGTVKGGFASEMVAQAEGQRLPDNANGRCAVKVVVDEQPGTIEVQSWSWGMSQAGKHTKTGHVTLMK
jgi:hypothetical protein